MVWLSYLILVIILVTHTRVASRVARHGPVRLWLTAAGFLLLIGVAGVLLGMYNSSPYIPMLLKYLLALTGPIVVVPTALLAHGPTAQSTKPLPLAFMGAGLGLVCGILIAGLGLGGW